MISILIKIIVIITLAQIVLPYFLSNSSLSVGSADKGQPSFPTCINEPWPPMTKCSLAA